MHLAPILALCAVTVIAAGSLGLPTVPERTTANQEAPATQRAAASGPREASTPSKVAAPAEKASATPGSPATVTLGAGFPATGKSSTSSEAHKDAVLDDIPQDQVISVDDLVEICKNDRTFKGFVIIDVRSLAKYDAGHIPGSFCVSAGRILEIRMREIPRDKDVVLIDIDGSRVAEVWQTLVDNDYDPDRIKVVQDGMNAWVAADLPTEKSTARMYC